MADSMRKGRYQRVICVSACLFLAMVGLRSLQAAQLASLGLPTNFPLEMTLEEAVQWGLRNNPELAAVRQHYGIAAAGVVIARTYPHNPSLSVLLQGVHGPADAGITNPLLTQASLAMPVEIRFQG